MPTLPSKPRLARDVLDTYFLETRAKLIEIAANMDRADRAPEAGALKGDPRMAFVGAALKILQGTSSNRAEQILRLYSKD